MAVNVLLADDHRMIREGLKQLLEMDPGIEVVGEAGDGYECLNLANKTKPNIVLLDLNMPNLDGLQVLNIMKQQKMICKVIILTIHNEVDYLIKALDIVEDVFHFLAVCAIKTPGKTFRLSLFQTVYDTYNLTLLRSEYVKLFFKGDAV